MNGTEERPIVRPFTKLFNFRDIGGLATADGRRMKAGVLFRSDDLSRLTLQDLDKLNQYGLKLICDLRTPDERQKKPDRLPPTVGLRTVHIPIYPFKEGEKLNQAKLIGMLLRKSAKSEFDAFNRAFYQSIAHQSTTQIQEVISLLSERSNMPALIHCTAGRDRTGYLSALIQLLVGVPMSTVLDEYELTNAYFQPRVRPFIRFMRWVTLFQIPPERFEDLLVVKREYLVRVLEEVVQTHGSMDRYVADVCGIDPSCVQRLKQLLLEEEAARSVV
ncbi:tyrosine-protein phosphatase [Paenibacillus validus]|uniref:tyrosine-protein phosphatase n=1 Tax=Paenibacillus validus TaxID=44253 RepID=UPI003D2B61E8